MLTEIEWWGGLLFIWMAIGVYLMDMDYRKEKNGSRKEYAFFIASNVLAAYILALYFYLLEDPSNQLVYVIAVASGIFTTAIWLIWPDQSNEASEEIDIDVASLVLGSSVVYGPVCIALGLGIYKSVDYIDSLPF